MTSIDLGFEEQVTSIIAETERCLADYISVKEYQITEDQYVRASDKVLAYIGDNPRISYGLWKGSRGDFFKAMKIKFDSFLFEENL